MSLQERADPNKLNPLSSSINSDISLDDEEATTYGLQERAASSKKLNNPLSSSINSDINDDDGDDNNQSVKSLQERAAASAAALLQNPKKLNNASLSLLLSTKTPITIGTASLQQRAATAPEPKNEKLDDDNNNKKKSSNDDVNNKDNNNKKKNDEIDEEERDMMKKVPIIGRLEEGIKTPTCVIVVGMAGSGKTTLMTQLQDSLDFDEDNGEVNDTENEDHKNSRHRNKKGYCLNLDPATLSVPFGASIDIRDTVDYKEVMKQHNLGPNGAIMTSLNLFATKFDQVLGILEKRADDVDYILVDTPGQIEAFTWSASGQIMSEALASSFPTVLVFVVDTVRCASSPSTFMSNMLYACSMLYRTRLPLVVAFNKIDVVPHDFVMDWMQDYEAFQEALDEMSTDQNGGYYSSLTRSLSLVLDEFYSNLKCCGVSAVSGDGIYDSKENGESSFWSSIDAAAQEFEDEYVQDLKLRMKEQHAKKKAIARAHIAKLQRDIDHDKEQKGRI
eukprot:CAMPEP_0194159626 /NCGR_PEP_ID=MMETSP0152-20130528/77942_1 /TAXON_ID=1049557 /ORGANISM="Thalassiothrix antarctica, Strain L6-D1" /LENGTH=504 /DNA_ID=CAMNT_0038869227 /DNA_START=12 /DNA_END=1527 /DNA_ORIENTATION=-